MKSCCSSPTEAARSKRIFPKLTFFASAFLAIFAGTSTFGADERPAIEGSSAFGVDRSARLVETGMGPAPFYTLKDNGADFIAVGTTTRSSTGIAEPFGMAVPAVPGTPVAAFIQWNWLLNGAPPGADAIVINGMTITGARCGSGTPDLCWGKAGAVAYMTAVPLPSLIIPGVNTIGMATDRAVGADPAALGEGLSLIIVYRVAGGPMRNVDLYCGYTSNISGPTFGTATVSFGFSNTYQGGLAHFFLNGLDTQSPTPGWEDSFFINGLAAGGNVNGTFPNPNAWRGLLGPMPINNLYDHADGPLGAPYLTPGDVGLTATTTLGPLGSGDCIGHSFGAIAFDIKDVFSKWTQLPKTSDGFDVPSNLDWHQLSMAPPGSPGPGPNIDTADDFQSDGRPITCVRFWGSYLDPSFIPILPNQPGGDTSMAAMSDRGPGGPGACCRPDGSCFITSETACIAAGGVFQGPGTLCPPNGCAGACCIGVQCFRATPAQCQSANGIFQGFGVPCVPNPCDTGCAPDAAGQQCIGQCPAGLSCAIRCVEYNPQNPSDFRIVDCECRGPNECQIQILSGGVFECVGDCPAGMVCERTETFNPLTGMTTICCDCAPLGACCIPGGPCIIVTANECSNQGGMYQGDGVPCVPNPCNDPVNGACCLPNGNCIITPATNCAANGGSYQGDGTVCGPSGACCLPSGLCVNMFEICCFDAGGTFIGGVCETITGACCYPDGTCIVTTRTCCLATGGMFQGPGVPCNNPNPCVEPPFGACCLPDGSCIILGPQQCQMQGGIYQGDNTTCMPNPCPDDNSQIDGWLISFHTDIPVDQNPDGFSKPGRLLALYFAPANAVSVIPTSLQGCDGHRVYEYVVELRDACLLHTYEDTRPGANPPFPGKPEAFYETAGFIYWLDIQAVVGHTVRDTCPNCTCDLNGDGVCDSVDLQILFSCFGQLPIGTCAAADINCDGVINAADEQAWVCLAQGNPPDVCCGAGECVEVFTGHFAEQDFWGWHTSRDHWNDNSTWSPVVMTATMEWFYPFWTPVPVLCGPNERVDQAFELLTPDEVPPCPQRCPDIASAPGPFPDGVVDVFDLFALLSAWGPCPQPCPPFCPSDFDCNCTIDVFDMFILLSAWGPCP